MNSNSPRALTVEDAVLTPEKLTELSQLAPPTTFDLNKYRLTPTAEMLDKLSQLAPPTIPSTFDINKYRLTPEMMARLPACTAPADTAESIAREEIEDEIRRDLANEEAPDDETDAIQREEARAEAEAEADAARAILQEEADAENIRSSYDLC